MCSVYTIKKANHKNKISLFLLLLLLPYIFPFLNYVPKCPACLHVHFVFTEVMVHFERGKIHPFHHTISYYMCKRQTKYKKRTNNNQMENSMPPVKFFSFFLSSFNIQCMKLKPSTWTRFVLSSFSGQIVCDMLD